jgi:hypothetical protein
MIGCIRCHGPLDWNDQCPHCDHPGPRPIIISSCPENCPHCGAEQKYNDVDSYGFPYAEYKCQSKIGSKTDMSYLCLMRQTQALSKELTRLQNGIDCAVNALTDSILVSGNDVATNLHFVRKLHALIK